MTQTYDLIVRGGEVANHAGRGKADVGVIDGRIVEMIKVGAYRVSPMEIEEAIALLPGVADVAAVAVPDDLLGHAIKAVIVPATGATLDIRAVKAHCRQRLATYKIPRIVEFVEALPRTASGKVQRRRLA